MIRMIYDSDDGTLVELNVDNGSDLTSVGLLENFKAFCYALGFTYIEEFLQATYREEENCGELGPSEGVVDSIQKSINTIQRYPGFTGVKT